MVLGDLADVDRSRPNVPALKLDRPAYAASELLIDP
jgi:hypothetical protein